MGRIGSGPPTSTQYDPHFFMHTFSGIKIARIGYNLVYDLEFTPISALTLLFSVPILHPMIATGLHV